MVRYTLKISNNGGGAFDDTLFIRDTLSPPVGKLIRSSIGGGECRSLGLQIGCKFNRLHLAPGQSRIVEMDFRIHEAARAAVLTNCAELVSQASLDGSRSDDRDCVRVRILVPEETGSISPIWEPPVRPVDTCAQNWTMFRRRSAIPRRWRFYRLEGGGTIVYCARKGRLRPPPCAVGWKKYLSRSAIPRNWRWYRIRDNRRSVYCAKRRPPCPGRQVRQPDGSCKCRRNDEFCKGPSAGGSTTRPCPRGTIGRRPNCKKISRPCPRGTIGTWPNRRKIPRINPPRIRPCRPGWRRGQQMRARDEAQAATLPEGLLLQPDRSPLRAVSIAAP
ncbi:hypothetical protein MnTg02_02106 [bacterium MnTg02]|nr:hypothetical protein MnTg02_02106 [bacterium MnTg02]